MLSVLDYEDWPWMRPSRADKGPGARVPRTLPVMGSSAGPVIINSLMDAPHHDVSSGLCMAHSGPSAWSPRPPFPPPLSRPELTDSS